MNYLNTKRIERQLVKMVKREYVGDGHYVFIQSVNVDFIEDKTIVLTISYGNKQINRNMELFISHHINMSFLKGMFYQEMFNQEQCGDYEVEETD